MTPFFGSDWNTCNECDALKAKLAEAEREIERLHKYRHEVISNKSIHLEHELQQERAIAERLEKGHEAILQIYPSEADEIDTVAYANEKRILQVRLEAKQALKEARELRGK